MDINSIARAEIVAMKPYVSARNSAAADGILLNVNEKYLKTMHFKLDDLKGKNVLDLVKSEREELKQVIEKVAKGEFHEKIMKRFTKYVNNPNPIALRKIIAKKMITENSYCF